MLKQVLTTIIAAANVACGSPTPLAQSSSNKDAQNAVKILCKEPANEWMSKTRVALQIIDTNLPNIPPEERAYLDRENNAMAALAPGDALAAGRRMQALESRPLYGAWQVRIALDQSTQAVNRTYEKDGMGVAFYDAEDANVLHRMMTLSTFLGSLSAAIDKYLDQESSMVSMPSGLSRPQFANLLQASGNLNLEFAMQCQLATVLAARH